MKYRSLRQTVFRASQCHNTKLWEAETGCSLVSTEYAHGKVRLSEPDLLVVLPITRVRIFFWPEGGSTFHQLTSRFHRKGANLEISVIISLLWVCVDMTTDQWIKETYRPPPQLKKEEQLASWSTVQVCQGGTWAAFYSHLKIGGSRFRTNGRELIATERTNREVFL